MRVFLQLGGASHPKPCGLCFCLKGTSADPRGRGPEYQLHVTLRRSVLLSARVPSDRLVSAADWDFEPQGGPRVLLVESISGRPPEINSGHRLGPRVEVINMTCLRIWDLEMGDDGLYKARVKFRGGGVEDYSFALTLHEPVPSPQVSCNVTSHFPEGCNVSLYCQGAGTGEFKVSWTEGEPPQALEEGGSDWYQLSGNGTALRLWWPFGSSRSPFTCLISSAAEEKRASLEVASCCFRAGAKETRRLTWLWCLLAIAPVVVLLGLLLLWRTRRKRTPSRGLSKREQPYEAKYSNLAAQGGSRGSSCGQPCDPLPEPRLKSPTVYAVLGSEPHLYNEAT
ncbi:uncharacterized protein LOC112540723 [Python bivittatus]|uniref:Uncharacterized protein LOC112540723 n=1 Tax=Python bivittatus TaxID=176946 RepID=A0A9F5ILY5_PYTBI|nr:uncharacterized protein LOC112540723 [Python bivittatus]